jgi:hypothetical protein
MTGVTLTRHTGLFFGYHPSEEEQRAKAKSE